MNVYMYGYLLDLSNKNKEELSSNMHSNQPYFDLEITLLPEKQTTTDS